MILVHNLVEVLNSRVVRDNQRHPVGNSIGRFCCECFFSGDTSCLHDRLFNQLVLVAPFEKVLVEVSGSILKIFFL